MSGVRGVAEEFVGFLNRAVTPFHAVEECAVKLGSSGFAELAEAEEWSVKAGSRGFVRRNGSCLVAWAAGAKWAPGGPTSIIAAHTDSPCLKLKPVSKGGAEGYCQLAVQPYGGGLWRTWFDRDLAVAGRLVHKDPKGALAQTLVHLNRPVCSIPNLAIHLETDRSKFEFKKQEHLRPIWGTAAFEKAEGTKAGAKDKDGSSEEEEKECDHDKAFLAAVAKEAGVAAEDVVTVDLHLLDAQPAALTGLRSEFVSGGRLDNLVGTYAAVWGLADSLDGSEAGDSSLRMVVCFDNEEVGSVSAQGAQSALLQWVLRRLHAAPLAFERSIPRSFLISADQAHALHPNYAAKHDPAHKIAMHKGVVVKVNANQRYATSAVTHAVLKLIAEKAGVPLQDFVVPNDSPCGSTVGPLLAANLGIQTIDVGTTQLAMHSVREMCDTTGIAHARQLYKAFFQLLPSILPAKA